MMGVTSGAGTICHSGAHEVDPSVSGVIVSLLKENENNLTGPIISRSAIKMMSFQ